MHTNQLFTAITSNHSELFREIEKPLLVNQFNVGNIQVMIMLTENYLVLCENAYSQVPTHFCKLTFSLKSQTLFQTISNLGAQQQPQIDLKKPLGIIIERQNCDQKVTFYSQYVNILDLWMKQLEKKINQRNFHKLFKAKKKIGKGAFATVYLAQRLRDKKMVAVKAFSKQKQYSGDKGRDSLQNQITLMRHINHSNIMRLEGVYQTQNSIYVILQYLEGLQLNQILKSNRTLTVQQKSDIIKCLLKGLQYLSSNRIIHRDLKPENIMFRKQSTYDAVICDFGLATFADTQKYLFVRCGTPGFVSPQIINIKDMTTKSDPISDVFSAGLIFHYLLFGHSIFPGKKYNEILNQNRACDFDFNQPKYQQISPLALDLLIKMLEKDPVKRFSAKKALSHSYFNSGRMQVQYNEQQKQKRSPFRQLSYNSYMQGVKTSQIQDTPSSFTHSNYNNRPSVGYTVGVNNNGNSTNVTGPNYQSIYYRHGLTTSGNNSSVMTNNNENMITNASYGARQNSTNNRRFY